MQTKCFRCGKLFGTDRIDAVFCSAACRAAYWRLLGDADQHADLPKIESKFCAHCGTLFWFNAYAKREGKRVPQYCSETCRVRAWRVKQAAAKEHQEKTNANPHSWEGFQEFVKNANKETPKRNASDFKTGDIRDSWKAPTRWTAMAAFTWIGVPYGSDRDATTAVWKALLKRYHPDVNQGKEWHHLKTVNAAYDYLKRRFW